MLARFNYIHRKFEHESSNHGKDTTSASSVSSSSTVDCDTTTTLPTATAAAATTASAVPEPATYAMLIAGLALLGLTARRRT